jgi:hypothetical protein
MYPAPAHSCIIKQPAKRTLSLLNIWLAVQKMMRFEETPNTALGRVTRVCDAINK